MATIIGLGVYIYPYAHNDFLDTSMAVTSDTLAGTSGYAAENGVYTPQEEGAYLELANSVTQVTTLEIYLNGALAEDQTATITYQSPDDSEQWISEQFMLEAGNDAFEIPMEKIQTGSILVGTDGPISLNQFVICGILIREDLTKTIVVYMLFLMVLIVLIVFFVRSKDGHQAWSYFFNFIRHFPTEVHRLYSKVNGEVYQFGRNHKLRIEYFFVIFGLIMGLFLSIAIPVGQTPDEGAHMMQIAGETQIGGLYEEYSDYLDVIEAGKMMTHQEIAQDKSLYKDSIKVRFDWSRLSFHFHPSISILRHLPASIGIAISVLLRLPIMLGLQLAELFSLLFFLLCGYKALRLMPVKKELLCFIMLLPMTLQQCASINYDSVLIPMSFLLTAYLFHCKYVAERVSWKQMIAIAGMSFVILIIKAPYVLIAGLVILIPASKITLPVGGKVDLFQILRKFWYLFAVAFVALFVAGCYVCRNVLYFQIIQSAFLRFPRYCTVIWNTTVDKLKIYEISFAGDFGWLDTVVENSFIVFVLIMLFVLSQTRTPYTKKRSTFCVGNRIIFGLLFVGLYILLHTIMLSWSYQLVNLPMDVDLSTLADYLYQITVIEGIQGRYFIPFVLFMVLPFDGILPTKPENMTMIQLMYYVSSIACVTSTVYTRYWH